MNNKMEPVTPVVVIQGAVVFALLAGFAFGLFTGQAHVAGLAMEWLSRCGTGAEKRASHRLRLAASLRLRQRLIGM